VPPLHQAAIRGETLIIEWLPAEGGARISEVDALGFTALLLAANHLASKNITTVQWLLEHGGSDITSTTPDGRTVWYLLARFFQD
jgi:ankyrin repeat protein